MNIELIINEPWDFISGKGDNHIKVKVIKKEGKAIIVEPLSDYCKTEYLFMELRDAFGNVNIFNEINGNKRDLIMIGTLVDKTLIKNWEDD